MKPISFMGTIMDCMAKYAHFHGRMSRRAFLYWCVFALIIFLLLLGYSYFQKSNMPVSLSSFTIINDELIFNYPVLIAEHLADVSNGISHYVLPFLIGVPTVSSMARRLHDTNRSAGWCFLLLLSIAGFIPLFILCCLPAKDEGNRFDNDDVIE